MNLSICVALIVVALFTGFILGYAVGPAAPMPAVSHAAGAR